jgi:hypothetical protein
MPHCSDAHFGAFLASGANRVGSNMNVGSRGVLMREPPEITRRKRAFEQHNSLRRAGGSFMPQEQGNGLTQCEATGEESCAVRIDLR